MFDTQTAASRSDVHVPPRRRLSTAILTINVLTLLPGERVHDG